MKTTEDIENEVIIHENKKLTNINLKNSELINIYKNFKDLINLFSYLINKIGNIVNNPNIK